MPAGLHGEADAAARALNALAPAGLLSGCRRIEPGDESHLLPAESASIASREGKARAATGAGRHIAHGLLRCLECTSLAVPRGRHGEPLWPAGIVGSIAHDDEFAVAVAATAGMLGSVGVDIEPALPLPDDLLSVVITPGDRFGSTDPRLGARILFTLKEAVYKAAFPLDGQVLGFEDIAVDFDRAEAVTSTGHRAGLRFAVTSRILALAYTTRP